MRQATELARGSEKYITGNSLVYTFIGAGDSLAASMAVPVRYNNRNSKDSDIEMIAYPGGYYLAASLEDGSTVDVGSELSFNLAIDVSGEAEDGPQLNATAAAGAAAMDTPSTGAADASQTSAPMEASAEAATPDSAGALWWGLGGAALLAAVAGVFVVRRRRSSAPDAG